MQLLQEYLPIVAQVIGYLTLGVTIFVKITPNKNDDLQAEKITGKIWKYINMLPSIGINPRTKALEEAYKEQQKK